MTSPSEDDDRIVNSIVLRFVFLDDLNLRNDLPPPLLFFFDATAVALILTFAMVGCKRVG